MPSRSGFFEARRAVNVATGAKVPNIYIDVKLSELDTPRPPPSRLQRLLRDPVGTAKKAVARLSGVAAH